ncbi:MAG: hypothetical protein JWP97_582, partial [Labilithrix sp.]|nr:hypothetical protein [Labilithrix sp.]
MTSFARWLWCVLSLAVATTVTGAARASPRALSAEDALDDQTAGGDLDAEDLVGRATGGRRALPRPLGGGAWVSLGAYTRTAELTGQREVGGLLVVGLPFDRVARRGRAGPPTLADAGLLQTAALPTASGNADSEAPALTARLARTAVAAAW